MFTHSHILTVEVDGTRYRGTYRIEGQELIVEAHGLGKKSVDASIVNYEMGKPAERFARLTFTQFIKESVEEHQDLLSLVVQGSTTQVAMIAPQA